MPTFAAIIGVTILVGLLAGTVFSVFAFDWSRPVRRAIQLYRAHLVTIGATRSGKTTARKKDAFHLIGQEAMLVIDPLGQFADELHAYAALHGKGDFVVMDDLTRHDKVLMYEVIDRSTDPDPITRMQENSIYREQALERFAQARNLPNFAEKPQLNRYLSLAIALYQNQREPVPQDLILDALRIGSPGYARLKAGCTDPRTIAEFETLEGYTPKYLNDLLQYSRQVLEGVLNNVTTLARISGQPTDFAELFRQKKCVILRSDDRVPNEATLFLGMSLIVKTFRIAARHKADTKTPLPLTIIPDECNGYPWVSPAVCKLLVQSAQWGIRFWPIFQFLDKTKEVVNQNLLQNCDLESFRIKDPDSAHLIARALATLRLDMKATKDVQLRDRTINHGTIHERVTTHSKYKPPGGHKEGKTENESIIGHADIEHVVDEQKTFLSLNEQIQLYEKALMTLPVGHRLAKRGTEVTDPDHPEKVIPLEEPLWDSLASSRATIALQTMREREPFQTPDLSRLLPKEPEDGPTAIEILRGKGTRG